MAFITVDLSSVLDNCSYDSRIDIHRDGGCWYLPDIPEECPFVLSYLKWAIAKELCCGYIRGMLPVPRCADVRCVNHLHTSERSTIDWRESDDHRWTKLKRGLIHLRRRVVNLRGSIKRLNGKIRRGLSTPDIWFIRAMARGKRWLPEAIQQRKKDDWTRKNKKRALDKTHLISVRIRSRIQEYLRLRKIPKTARTFDSLDYGPAELIAHIERQFVKGMGWHNRDKWDVDHIVPLASFKFTSMDDPEFKAAWALTNLRPLWKKDNRAKGATRTHLL